LGLASKRIATQEPPFSLHFTFGELEIGTRFKEDCDIGKSPWCAISTTQGWKLGLASKRIATGRNPLTLYASRIFSLEIGTRFKEDCDPVKHRLVRAVVRKRLEIGTRFKEDCDIDPEMSGSTSSAGLEIGTRFKEDCDLNPPPLSLRSALAVGNWDSLQRGLRIFPRAKVGRREEAMWKG